MRTCVHCGKEIVPAEACYAKSYINKQHNGWTHKRSDKLVEGVYFDTVIYCPTIEDTLAEPIDDLSQLVLDECNEM